MVVRMNISVNSLNSKDIDNISLTAYRILSILKMLLERPCSDKEINEKLQMDIIGARSLSQDTICIYMNTLRAVGCEISRPSKNNNYKYVLKNNPFKLKLSEQEVNAIVKTRKYAITLDNWELNLKFDKIRKILYQQYLHSDTLKLMEQQEKTLLHRYKNNFQHQMINALEKYCNKKLTLLINYNSPISGEKIIKMAVDKISFENGAFYVWGYNTDLEETQYLRIDKIKEIQAINIKNSNHVQKIYSIEYKLTGLSAIMFTPNSDETVISKSKKELIIRSTGKSKFKIIQSILSYGSDCTVISPEDIKQEIIDKLKSAYKIYNKE